MRRLRVAYLVPSLNLGGSETLLLYFLRRLDRERFEPQVHVFYPGARLAGGVRRAGIGGGGWGKGPMTLGGAGTETAVIGGRGGPGFSYDQIVPAIERLIMAYLDLRDDPGETFLQSYRRLGMAPFKAALYPPQENAHAA